MNGTLLSPWEGLLAFWPFASGLMLLWGLAAAVPIIIHLWNRRKYREVSWAAMEYLLAALRKNARRVRLEQLLLLAIRVLILLLLAVALADPLLSGLSSLAARLSGGVRTHHLIVIDGSYSMGYRTRESSLFEQAREMAADLVESAAQGDGFTLLLMTDPPQTVIRAPAFDPQDVLEELAGLDLPQGGARLTATLAEVESILQQAARQQPDLTRSRVKFYTDLGATTWNDVHANDCRDQIGRLAEKATLNLIPLEAPDNGNLAVTRLVAGDSLPTVADTIGVSAELQNFGRQDVSAAALRFFVDERMVHEETVDIPAGGRATAAFNHRIDSPGEHSLEARLADDPLPDDNHRWLSLPVRQALRVLCIAGKNRAARHVAFALQPQLSDQPSIVPEIQPESALLELDLQQYDCVFLCNVGRFGNDEAAVLHDYVSSGGGLVILLGDQVQADSYNRELGDASSGRRVLPARLGEIVGDTQRALDPLDYQHPIVQPFRGHERTGLLTTPIWTYVQLAPVQEAARVVLALDNGDPLLVEERIGRGRCLLLATAASPDSLNARKVPPTPWNALAAWPSFVPLMQQMLRVAVSGREEHRNVMVGEPLVGLVRGRVASTPLTISAPKWPDQPVAGGPAERVQLEADGNDSRWVYVATQMSGIYAAKYESPLNLTQLFGVNVDTRESSLERFDAELLPSQFNPSPDEELQSGSGPAAGRSGQLFRYILAAVLLLLVGETALGGWFGSGAA